MESRNILQANLIGGLNAYINDYGTDRQKVEWDTIVRNIVDTEEHLVQAMEDEKFFKDLLMFGTTVIYGMPKVE